MSFSICISYSILEPQDAYSHTPSENLKKKITGKRYFSKFKKETSKPVRGKMSDELSRAERKVMDLLSRKIN